MGKCLYKLLFVRLLLYLNSLKNNFKFISDNHSTAYKPLMILDTKLRKKYEI